VTNAMALGARLGLGAHHLLRHAPALSLQIDDRIRRVVVTNAETIVDSEGRNDGVTVAVLGAIDPRRVDERLLRVAVRALDSRAQPTMNAAPEVRRFLFVCRVWNVAAVFLLVQRILEEAGLPSGGVVTNHRDVVVLIARVPTNALPAQQHPV